jgi:hypothetical protein
MVTRPAERRPAPPPRRRIAPTRRWPSGHFDFFFSCFAARFSFIVFAGCFLTFFFWSMPLLMTASSLTGSKGIGRPVPIRAPAAVPAV